MFLSMIRRAFLMFIQGIPRGLQKICRLSWLTNRALVYEPKCGRRGELRCLSQWEQPSTGAKINFGDLTSYLTYEYTCTVDIRQSGLCLTTAYCWCMGSTVPHWVAVHISLCFYGSISRPSFVSYCTILDPPPPPIPPLVKLSGFVPDKNTGRRK